jgi:DNA repair protein RecO (recombination protein O)
MEPRRVQGLVLRLRELGESDLLVDLFTAELGRATALAKGGRRSRKRFAGLLLSGHLLEAHLAPPKKGSDLWRLEAASLAERHLGLRRDHRRLLAAGPVWELLLRATAVHDPQPLALELSLLTLARLAAAADRAALASGLIAHLARLLSLMGYGLSLEACLVCAKDPGPSPRLSLAGGAVCSRCQIEGAWQVPAGLVRGLAAAQGLEPRALARLAFPPAAAAPGLAFLAEFWRRAVGHDLPALGLAQRLLSRGK